MDIGLNGRRAIVCGSSQGIGRAIAEELARLGASLTLLARNETALQEVRQNLQNQDDQTHKVIRVDFADVEGLSKNVHDVVESVGQTHILVNNTGGPAGGPVFEAEPPEFIQAFSNHLVCNQILARAVVPGMKSCGYGRIINIISTSVKQPIKGLGVSNTIRGAVANWAKTLATELGPFGITVNNVLPGATSTARLESIIGNRASKTDTTAEEVSEQMKSEIPMHRFAVPEEIANAVAFLASPAAAYITGINLPVDGGRTSCL
jgi:3-oxoacyl-[acyl-carrier protein] reductase